MSWSRVNIKSEISVNCYPLSLFGPYSRRSSEIGNSFREGEKKKLRLGFWLFFVCPWYWLFWRGKYLLMCWFLVKVSEKKTSVIVHLPAPVTEIISEDSRIQDANCFTFFRTSVSGSSYSWVSAILVGWATRSGFKKNMWYPQFHRGSHRQQNHDKKTFFMKWKRETDITMETDLIFFLTKLFSSQFSLICFLFFSIDFSAYVRKKLKSDELFLLFLLSLFSFCSSFFFFFLSQISTEVLNNSWSITQLSRWFIF